MTAQIANWRDASQYPNGSDVSPEDLAWEFLRRSPGFQADYRMVREIRAAIIAMAVESGSQQSSPSHELLASAAWQEYSFPIKVGDTQWELDAPLGEYLSRPLNLRVADKWGLDLCCPMLPDPFFDYKHSETLSLITFKGAPRVWLAGPHWPEFYMNSGKRMKDAYIIDYSRPLKPQLEAIGLEAEQRQQELIARGKIDAPVNMKNRTKEWITYLRILDGKAAGASLDAIAETLYPDATNTHPDYQARVRLNKAITQAMALRDHDYRYIPHVRSRKIS